MVKNENQEKETVVTPDLHIHGDLADASSLIAQLSRKKTVIVYRNGEDGSLFTSGKKEPVKRSAEELTEMNKSQRLLYADFFPSRKKVIPAATETPEIPALEEEKKKVKEKKKGEKKVKSKSKGKKKKSEK